MKRWLLVGWIALAVFFSWPSQTAFAQLLSPGPLSKAHKSLEGDSHCNDCHSSGKRVDANACLKCHGDLGARIAAGAGLHGRQYKGQPCEKCHAEHLGAKALLRWPDGDAARLDHALTGWVLNGAHAKTPCAKCHTKANARGAPTYLGLSTACTSCHRDQHQGRFGEACLTCHNEASWKEVAVGDFNHDLARFALRGAHKTVPCAKCHFEPPKYTGLRFGACGDCHKDPHAGRLGTVCQDCHEDMRWKPVTFRHGSARHPGTSLANGHAGVACGSCHDAGNLVSPSKGKECVSCHRPVHKAPFGRACASCHATIQWLGLPRSIGLAAHPRTSYPLTGKHEAAACTGCHNPKLPTQERFRKLAFNRCTDCHQDQHNREFANRDGGECKSCHATRGFYPTLFGSALHAQTKFPLVGKHMATACSACHKTPRPRTDLHVAKQACADCHENPHGNQFATEMAQGGCAHCHEATGWKLPKIDHRTWPLTGAHATALCDSCHHPTAEDRKKGTGASYRGIPRQCGGCHDDAHLGQFRLKQPVLECDRCHATKDFKIPDFNHQSITGWGLTGTHARTTCDKCHAKTSVRTPSGPVDTVRWRLPSHECKYCHANPHERREGP